MLDPAQLPHALTLNTDRQLSPSQMGKIFSTFCLNVDRTIHDRKNVHKIPSRDRFRAIALPEHLESNGHLHVAADLAPFFARFPTREAAVPWLTHLWRCASRDTGSVHFVSVRDCGWGEYMTKAISGPDPTYFLSIDFHQF